MTRAVAAALAVLAFAAQVPAQGQDQGEEHRSRIRREIEQMRDSMREGSRQVVTNVRIMVRLNNGNKMRGVIKNGRFIEKVRNLDFVPADKATPGAGVRVWYSDNTNSYVFLRHDEIATYRIGARLTDVQIREIEERIAADRERAEKARALQLAKQAAEQQRETEEEKAKAEAEAAKKERQESDGRDKEKERLNKLLAEFPPDQGWGPEKIEEIRQRAIIIGVAPDEKSKRFIEIFADWQKAKAMADQAKSAEPPAPTGR